MRRTLTWLVTLPFAAVSVVFGHAIAYRVTGLPADDLHGYLAHAPQVLLVLASVGLVGLAADARARRHSPVPLATLAVATFVAQEHLERLIHTGHLPFLLASPVLWVGIALQIPLAAAVWIVSSRLADVLAVPVRRTFRRVSRVVLILRPVVASPTTSGRVRACSARGPPLPS